jgi:RecA-family ATPase
VSAYLDLPASQQTWLWEPILPAGGLVCLYSQPKIGKSWLAIQLGQALASPSQSELLGFKIRQHGPVLYLQLDTPRSLWQGRFFQLQSQGIDFSEQFILADREDVPFPFDILNPLGGQRWLADACRQIQPVAVIIDTLVETHQLDENKTQEMKGVINTLQHVVAPAALVLITHAKKENPLFEASVIGGLRGNTAIPGKMDTIIQLNKTTALFEGRAMEETKLSLQRDPDTHLWQVSDRETAGPAASDLKKQAARLAAQTGMALPIALKRVKQQTAKALAGMGHD